MNQTVWVIMRHDDWNESHSLYGVYSTREKAEATLKERYEDIVCDERFDRWDRSDPDSTVYFYLYEEEVE